VASALFHTQGGLAVDRHARARGGEGAALPNLVATAAGVSGSQVSGYLWVNGLLAATVLGWIAGASAAKACGGHGLWGPRQIGGYSDGIEFGSPSSAMRSS
jgi:fumarate reductase flavoprotein subunit